MIPRWRILISAPYLQPALPEFRALFDARAAELVVPRVRERLSEDELLPLVEDIDGAICGDDRFSERVLRTARRLKVIAKWGTGIDSIDQAYCAKAGIAVRNTPGAFTDPVADSVLGYMLAFARQQPWMAESVRAGEWRKLPGRALHETVLGIVGVGRIGRAVARRARAFGARVLATDPVLPPPEVLTELQFDMTSLPDLLSQADFVSLNCDLNPTSHHLLGAPEFSMIKPGAVLINTARGSIVDEPALIAALEEGRLGGAALDVFEVEPLPLESPLRRMPNVMGAAHNSNSSPSAWARVHEHTINLLFEVLEGDGSR